MSNIDLHSFNESYKKCYSSARSGDKKPKGHIDSVTTFFIDIGDEQIDEYEKLGNGLSPEKMAPYLQFIHDNLPTFNVKIIASFGGHIRGMTAFIVDEKAIQINGLGEMFKKEEDPETHKLAMSLSILYNLCKRLSEDNTYLGQQEVNVFNPRKGKEFPMTITYISKNKKPQYISPISNNKIDWKHSWAVSGHWRKIKGIGKDRYGERNTINKTWVTPCIKGSGSFVEKLKVVNL